MKVIVKPSRITGSITTPPSKSMAHRLIIAAGLAEGESIIHNVALSEDIKATIGCLEALGASVKKSGDKSLEITGTDPRNSKGASLNCNESGSTLRFMIPIAAMAEEEMRFSGTETLMKRPLSVYEDIFKKQGLGFKKSSDGLVIKGRLSGGEFEIPGDISSQFITGLLMALPLAEGDSIIKTCGELESRPYVDMTLEALRAYGIKADWTDERTLRIPGRQIYQASEQTVEGDWSNAAYLMAHGAAVTGLDDNSLQGDKLCKGYFKQIEDGYCELNIRNCPDLGPVLMAYAAMHEGCTLHGTRRLKIKESDRAATMKEELSKFGIHTETEDDSIKVGCGINKPEQFLCGHNDHRIVMALCALCMKTGGIIEGAEAVNKSFPDFFERIKEAGADIEEI